MVVRHEHDWRGQHLIIGEVQPSGIALARGGDPTRAVEANPFFSASTEGGHISTRGASAAIRGGKVSGVALARPQ